MEIRYIARRLLAACVLACAALAGRADSRPVVIGNSRFTFITDHLVRMEYAQHQKFLDDSTLFAVDRSPREVDYSVARRGRTYVLSTPAMRIEYDDDGLPFGQNNLRVFFQAGGKERRWCLTDQQSGNLGGPVTTVDAVAGPLPLPEGLLSRDGWYLINDTGADVWRNGWLAPRDRDHVQDLYLFVYGEDYKAALRALKAVSGPVPMTRKYVHGSWYCRWWPYTAGDYRELAREYHEHGFPLDIMVFDMDWHRKDAKVGLGHAFTRGWTGYSWNRELIPDPAGLVGELRRQGIYVTLNDHPHDGIRPHEDMYADFMRSGLGLDPERDPVPPFDAGDRRYMEAFMDYAHRESDSLGVAFWWLDWQQDYAYPWVRGTRTRHLPWLNALYYAHSRRDGLRGQGFSRWGGWGDHRHPIQFSGDAVGNWAMLDFEVKMTTASGNAGCFFWAHDIGGFYDGLDPELYTRWTQYGLLNSSLRIHSVAGKDMDRRPWLWGQREEQAMRRVYRLRSRLMPYIYTSVRQCHTDMLPLLRGLYIAYPGAEEAYRHDGQFLFGDLVLGAPVTRPGEGEDKVARQQVWFPGGADWYSLFTGRKYEGGQQLAVDCPLEESPVFVKGGWPLPMQPYRERMASAPLDTLVVRCYPGRVGSDNTYTLYEDDGLTTAYERGAFAETPLRYRRTAQGVAVSIGPARGAYDGQPRRRAYRIELPGIDGGAAVRVDGRRVKAVPDGTIGGIVVNVRRTDIRRGIEVEVTAE